MNFVLSSVVNADPVARGGHFAARRLDLDGLGRFAAPVMGLDHYRMSGPTFAAHPHAGFSAVSYVLEDSAGGLRSRDSLQHDVVIEPGAIVWTQAGTGIVHDEFPAQMGREVHALQVSINLSRQNKSLPPRMFQLATTAIPVVSDANGNRTRVLSGGFSDTNSLLELAEPFDFLDVTVLRRWSFQVPKNRNVLVYVLSGNVEVRASGQSRALRPLQAVAGRCIKPDILHVTTTSPAQILLLSGTDPREPVAVYGPFIMNDEAQLTAAFDRYRKGEMGRLAPLS
ncbi:pirin family protein [Burkholderia sp. lig30]|jgi:redox-sensitive bicupin YhaK (pirin superfamily)|uniref:pirin family protein n=1 Tax=Burkholderia sp. lig30 TaxID=1192124 RepID=UPI0013665E1F|nr:pirin-like C-terminal cupin domain-containing protein [Burkholderia sp. lig30]